ncbi:MAG: acyl--CoA ligase [Pseudodesulfovibrio sp.]|nr:acyl--CoA ligase [Pseudodesulfovibrio sp.]
MTSAFANISEQVFDIWSKKPDGLVFDDGMIRLSGLQFMKKVGSRQGVLAEAIQPGDRVVIQAGRGVEYFVDMLAVWRLGGVVVPLAADADTKYIDHVLGISGASLILDGKSEGEPISLEYVSQSCAATKPDDLAALLFTSGSTGAPKGVMLSHEVLLRNCLGILDVLKMDRDRLFINIPFNFTSGICHFLACVFSNSTLIGVENKLFLADLPRTMDRLKATAFGGAPIQLRWLAETFKGLADSGQSLGSPLRFVMSSGDHLPTDVIDLLRQVSSTTNIFTVYGLTELGGRFCILDSSDIADHAGSVGKPISGLGVTIVDFDNNRELGAGVEGEIVAKGELLCQGYYRDEKRTTALFSQWGLRTGDIGYLDAHGFLHLTGRSDDVFKVNGQKVAATVINNAMMRLAPFADAATISMEIALLGTVPVVAYTLKEGAEFKKGEILGALRKILPSNHIPHQFVEVGEIPRTGSGKVERHTLRLLLEK